MTNLNVKTEPNRMSRFASDLPQPLRRTSQTGQRYKFEGGAALHLQQTETLLRETQHRFANTLQIIASILALDARNTHSDEARLYLENAHRRILAVAAVHQQLQDSRDGGDLEIAAYLRELCRNLSASVVADRARIAIDIRADAGRVSTAFAMNLGLIISELVINAIKHAFVAGGAPGRISVTYRAEGAGWRITVSDDGVGKQNGVQHPASARLGTDLVAALVEHLGGRLETSTGQNGIGTQISITNRNAIIA